MFGTSWHVHRMKMDVFPTIILTVTSFLAWLLWHHVGLTPVWHKLHDLKVQFVSMELHVGFILSWWYILLTYRNWGFLYLYGNGTVSRNAAQTPIRCKCYTFLKDTFDKSQDKCNVFPKAEGINVSFNCTCLCAGCLLFSLYFTTLSHFGMLAIRLYLCCA